MFKLCLLVFSTLALGPQAVKGFVGEIEAKSHEFIYHVLLKRDLEFFCNGALITRKHVLTAGYCIEIMRQFTGVTTAVILADYMHGEGISRIVRDRDIYQSEYSDNLQFNLNIFLMEQSLPDWDLLTTMTIPVPSVIPFGQAAIVTAIGHTYATGPNNPHMQKLPVRILQRHICVLRLNCRIEDYQICAEALQGGGLTPGDIGAPLVWNNIIYGIAAGTAVSEEDHPDIYINVMYYRDWIIRIMQST